MVENLVFDGPYSKKDFFNFITTSLEPRHRWYYFKEGFSSNVVKEAIASKARKKGPLNILDVFNGCGTTVLTSALLGHKATGIEVNPFLEFATRVKTSTFNFKRETFINFSKDLINKSKWGNYCSLEGISTFTSTPELNKWLFNTSVIRRFASISGLIDGLPRTYKSAFRFILIAAIMDCCNARKDGKSLRYKRKWQDLNYSSKNLAQAFVSRAITFIDDIEQAPIKKESRPIIILGDSRQVLKSESFPTEKFDILVTSPPYLNSFDYSDIYRAELFLGGFIKNNSDLKSIRLKTIRSHVQVDWNKSINFESKMLKPYIDSICEKGDFWSSRIPLMIKAYFDDMSTVLNLAKPKLNRNAEVWIVVSTSAYSGVHIPVDLLIADVACQNGYLLKGIHCLRYLRTSSQQYKELNTKTTPLRESLIILKK
jgi:hypothetical protein